MKKYAIVGTLYGSYYIATYEKKLLSIIIAYGKELLAIAGIDTLHDWLTKKYSSLIVLT